ncbi:MAG: hypothetical protein ACR2IK_23375 [Chloroflexota bacterium]
MTGSFSRFVPALGGTIILLVLAIGFATVVHPTGFNILSVIVGLIMLGCLALAAYLFSVCSRPLAAIGAVVVAAAVWSAFYLTSQAAPWLVWTLLFFVGIGLIAFDTGKDTIRKAWWPLALLRVVVGWAWVDNAQDHFRVGNWLAGDGGQFGQVAAGAAQRPATFFLDALYQGFLRAAVVANPDAWAALTACGELTFGLMLAMGVLTPVAAWLSLWQSTNYVLMKGLLAHGGYTDKVFFIADLMVMLTGAGLVYGTDAALQRHVPAWFARWLLGVVEVQTPVAEPTRVGRVSPEPT